MPELTKEQKVEVLEHAIGALKPTAPCQSFIDNYSQFRSNIEVLPLSDQPDDYVHPEKVKLNNLSRFEAIGAHIGAIGGAKTKTGDSLLSAEQEKSVVQEYEAVNTTTNRASSYAPPYLESCHFLGIDPQNPTYGGITLKAHQITACAWASTMLTILRVAYVADDVGLGKTIQALSTVRTLYEQVLPIASQEKPKWPLDTTDFKPSVIRSHWNRKAFKPTLILFPASASSSWKDDLSKMGGFTVRYWMSSPTKFRLDSEGANLTLGTKKDDLDSFIDSLDSTDPKTGMTVILSSITTFGRRGIVFANRNRSDDDDDEDEDEDDDREQALVLDSPFAGKFGLIIVDEAHKLKNRKSHAHNVSSIKTWELFL